MNPVKQKAYKVVRITDEGVRTSANGSLKRMPKIRVVYEEGKLIQPKYKGASLFVFKDEKAAAVFFAQMSRGSDSFELWEVEAYGCKNPPARLLYLDDAPEPENWLARFWWEKQRDTFGSSDTFTTPEGSMLCNSLRLTKKLDY